jgi:prephenate dehydrogenase
MSGEGSPIGRVAIVGAGQIGTMLGVALKGAPASYGVEEIGLLDRDPSVATESLARGAGHRALDHSEDALGADTLILALPIPEIIRFIEGPGREMRPGTVVVDTGSVKRPVVRAMQRCLPRSARGIGGHPVCGTERPGPAGADPDLVRGAPFVLTSVRDDAEALARGRAVAAAVGARPVEMDADSHDLIVARTSDLPHLVAFALARVVAEAGDREEVAALVATGYAGATRLAASDPAMVAGSLAANADQVRLAVQELVESLEAFVSALSQEAAGLEGVLAEAGAMRLGRPAQDRGGGVRVGRPA